MWDTHVVARIDQPNWPEPQNQFNQLMISIIDRRVKAVSGVRLPEARL